jgi:FkbM family methyltransferase
VAWFGSKAYDLARGALPLAQRLRSFTFAQYAEDTLLYLLQPQREGFYVDVGAYHPWQGSNSYKLYLRGWRGITIEPNPEVAPLFRRLRPRDLHLNLGVSGNAGELAYYHFDDAKLNSFDGTQAGRMNCAVRKTTAVPCLPLSEIVARHAPDTRIDMLSIDCEGLDLEVLKSLDWEATRPSVLVIEDFEQFRLNAESGTAGRIRTFLSDRGYALLSQAMFSFLYLDRSAVGRSNGRGFRLDHSQAKILAG